MVMISIKCVSLQRVSLDLAGEFSGILCRDVLDDEVDGVAYDALLRTFLDVKFLPARHVRRTEDQ